LEYAIDQTNRIETDAILGFSQGGTLATALALSGAFPNLKCVITSGAPFVAEALDEAAVLAKEYSSDGILDSSDSLYDAGLRIPKFHMAGENDALVPVESTKLLCEKGGSGSFVMHEQGHLFPTRSGRVQEVLDFLAKHIN
jgi:predicted esterase